MNIDAVKHIFKPVSRSEQEALVRKHVRVGLCEQSVSLEEVGIDKAAREAVDRAKREHNAQARQRQYEY